MTWLTYIDGNSVAHAANHGAKKEKKLFAGSQETTALFGLLKSMNVILRERTSAKPIVLWDGRSWRFERFPEYKAGRTDTAEKLKEREAYKSQAPFMRVALHLLGIRQLIASNMEADDLAAILVRDGAPKGNKIALVTGDQDWLQLVQPGVTWVDHKIDRKCNHADFHKFTGYPDPKAFIHSKSLQGDTGDNVKPNIGIGEKGALQLLSVFPCVHSFQQTPLDEAKDKFFLAHGKNLTGKMVALHQDKATQERFEWARELMDLGHPSIPAPVGLKMTHAPLDRAKFEQFCGKFAMHSLLARMDSFIHPFTTLDKEFN